MQNIAVQSECQRALIKNLGQTQLTLRQFAAETARNFGLVSPPTVHLGAEQGSPRNGNSNLPSQPYYDLVGPRSSPTQPIATNPIYMEVATLLSMEDVSPQNQQEIIELCDAFKNVFGKTI